MVPLSYETQSPPGALPLRAASRHWGSRALALALIFWVAMLLAFLLRPG